MKKLFFYLLAGTVLLTASCKDKTEDGDTFSSKSVEENKQSIETSGIEMINEMQEMEEEPAMQANIAMVTFIGTSDPFEGNTNLNQKIILPNTIAFAPVFAAAKYNGSNVKGMLKSIQINPAQDPETIQEAYDMLVGVYTWNSNTETWDYVNTGTIIKFEFPAAHDGTTNNAVYTVSYTGYTGPNPLDNYDGDLPQNVTTELKVDGTLVMSFVVDIAYNTNGYPTSIESTLTLGQWTLYAMASNTNNAAFATEFSFKHANKILLRLTLDAAGNWSKENIEANTTYYKEVYYQVDGYWYWEEVEVTKDDDYDYSEMEDVHKVINSGNASFQAMDLKIVGSIDALNFGEEMKRIDETYDWETQEEQIVAAQVVAINKYVNLSLRYAESNEIIALVEAYPVSEEESYETYWYNETWHETPITVTETHYWFDMRFVFADGSNVDAETYFGEGFEDVIDEFEAYLDELETTYGKK